MMIPKINHLFFTIYFLLFASFPSIHCHINESPCSADNTPCGISFIKPIPSDKPCCEVHSNTHDSHEHHIHFLVDEAGTTHRSNDIFKITLLNKKTWNINELTDLYSEPLFVNSNQKSIAKSVDGFRDLWSGLSPPII